MTYSDETFDRDMDGYFLKLSPNCELLWTTYFYTRNSLADDKIYSIASDGGERLYFTGTVNPKEFQTAENTIPLQDNSTSSVLDYYQSIIPNQSPGDPFNIPASDGFWGCFDSLKLENTAGIKLKQVNDETFIIYPNPTSFNLSIEFSKDLIGEFQSLLSDKKSGGHKSPRFF